jgi:uncharacterized damage-inducible protein DinB
VAAEPEAAVRDEASGFATYLAYLRESIAEAVLALSAEEQRTTRLASGWTPIELLSHVLHMERRWFVWGFLGEQVTDPWGDWSRDDPWDGPESGPEDGPEPRWQVPADVTAESLAERLREVGARTTQVLAEHDLDEVAPPSLRWDHTDGTPSLRWICFHVLHEYARHAGHLDIAVELATPIRQQPVRGEDPPDR